jgi:hypothetical protein
MEPVKTVMLPEGLVVPPTVPFTAIVRFQTGLKKAVKVWLEPAV